MSRLYDEYLKEHCEAVANAYWWMRDNLTAFKELSAHERGKSVVNVMRHDASKWGNEEYDAYDAHFFGDEGNDDEFSRAWLHHIHNNPHHWQHWVLVNGYGNFSDPGVVTALEMPKVYALEMIADWWSFSWRSGNLNEVFGWYDEHRDKIVLHEATREFVERVLVEIREGIEER